MPLYEYQGNTYDLPEGLSTEEAKEKIISYLSSQEKSAPQETQTPSNEEAPATAPIRQPETEQESTTQEIAEGLASGLIGIPQGILELGASAADVVLDTNYAENVTDTFESFRAAAGIDPEGAAGEIAEVVGQFVIPGGIAAAGISKIGLLANAPTFVRTLAQMGAAGVTDAVVATEGTTTIGDFFEGGVTQTTDLIGLEGREAALARMGNKAKLGFEAAGATGLIEPVLKGLGLAGRLGTKALTPVVAPVARATLQAGTALSDSTGKAAGTLMGPDNYDKVLSVFRSRGNLPQDVFEVRSAITGKVEAEATQAATTLKSLTNNIDEAYKGVETLMLDGSPLTRADLNNNLFSYLTGEVGEEMLPEFIKAEARAMRGQVDDLSDKAINSQFLSRQGSEELIGEIKSNIGSYLRRKYKLFEDGGYRQTDEFLKAKEDTITLFKDSPDTFRSFWQRVYGEDTPIPENVFTGVGKSERVSESAAKALTEQFLDISAKRKTNLAPLQAVSRTAIDKMKTDMFKARAVNNQTIRRLLGEVKDPQEAFISTVADLAEFNATDDFLGYIARSASDQGQVLTKEAYNNLPAEARRGYEVLSEDYWGAAQDFAVSRNMFKDLTRVVTGDLGTMGNVARATYSGFLKAKGATQFAKTVLSPITQIRNVTSAAAFALAQGNVGRGANLMESLSTVMGNIAKRPDKLDYYTKLQRLGVVGNQAQLREIDRLVREGFGITRDADEVVAGVRVGNVGNMFTRSKPGKILKAVGGKAREAYQGGDDVWKIYNFEFEKGKLLSKFGSKEVAERAIGKDLDEYAADIVKNTVPNYERVPQFVKGLRKLPLGNFIAFPAEILRTSANTLKQSLDELASESPQLREIGMRRLTGLTATTVIAPAAVQSLAMTLTGVAQEQIDAVRRSAPPWSRNGRLLPTSVDKDGNITGYVDYSYTNPYDYLQRPIQGIFNAVKDGKDIGKDTDTVVMNAMGQALSEFVSPFTDESIIAEKLLDTTVRGGRTKTGARVYREVDTPGVKIAKSLTHILDSFVPGASPVNLKAQKKETQMPGIEAGRFLRGTINLGTDAAGNERQAGSELLRALTGVTEIEVKPDNIVMYSSYEYNGNIRSARQIFNTSVRTKSDLTEAEAVSTFRDANEALYRVQNEMYQTVLDMERLGMKKSQIRKSLKKYKIGNVNELMRGTFVPMDVSSEVKKEVRRNGNRLPMSELRAIRKEFRGRKLGEPVQQREEREAPTVDVSSVSPTQQPPAAVVAPTVGLGVGAQQTAPAAPTPSNIRSNPAVYSSNPVDALKAMVISQRNP